MVVGFSAGGMGPLMQLVADLPPDFPASIFVVHHFPAQSVSALPNILNRTGPLPASQPADGERIRPGRIYAACPDRHLLVRDGRIRLSSGPREHGHRPAIDPLFRSAARSYGPRVVGVMLSGTLHDGTTGLIAIKGAGGIAVVQDPEHAAYPGMPASAIQHVPVDHVVPPSGLAALLDRLVREPAPEPPSRDRGLHRAAAQYEAASREAQHGSNLVRETLLKGPVRQALETPAEPVGVEEPEQRVGADRA